MMILLAGLVVALGALVQGTVGFGMALIAAPLLAIIDPALLPVPMLLLTLVHAPLTLRRERGDTDWRGVGWALVGRLPGIGIGVLAVATLSPRGFAAVIGVVVLVCAGLSVLPWRPKPTVPALLLAGVVSGAGGTAAAISGPPIALLYRDAPGAQVRSTLAAYFIAGAVLSLTGLALAGEVTPADLLAGALLVPFMVAGYLLSTPTCRVIDAGRMRPAVIGLAAAGAVALLVQAALGS